MFFVLKGKKKVFYRRVLIVVYPLTTTFFLFECVACSDIEDTEYSKYSPNKKLWIKT